MFVVAGCSERSAVCSSPTGRTCPKSAGWTTTVRARSRACLHVMGRSVSQFATERRVVVRYEDIAPALRQAIIAKEDAEFEQHFGLSLTRIVVAAIKDVLYGISGAALVSVVVRAPSPSSLHATSSFAITCAAACSCAPAFEASNARSRNGSVAIEIEKRYTKREIFTFYANQINLGHGAYGVEAAARMYFSKSAKDVTLEEAATLAAIIQTPARLSPFVDLERNRYWRNYVLRRMAAEGYITSESRSRGAGASDRAARTTAPRSVDCALFRRRDPKEAREPARRQRPVCRGPHRADDARSRVTRSSQSGARSRAPTAR